MKLLQQLQLREAERTFAEQQIAEAKVAAYWRLVESVAAPPVGSLPAGTTIETAEKTIRDFGSTVQQFEANVALSTNVQTLEAEVANFEKDRESLSKELVEVQEKLFALRDKTFGPSHHAVKPVPLHHGLHGFETTYPALQPLCARHREVRMALNKGLASQKELGAARAAYRAVREPASVAANKELPIKREGLVTPPGYLSPEDSLRAKEAWEKQLR